MKPIIEFTNYSFKYRAQAEPTIRDINLKIYPGEKILIVGPSGSGKSTLAHCINGLVPFSYKGESKGSLLIKGQNPEKLSIFEIAKMVGTVLQDTDGQFIGLTVAEDIAFALENDVVAQEEMVERVHEAAELVDLTEYLNRSPGDLSGGQKQRVSMAGVMVDNVDILLLDEPLANLDPATGKSTIARIDEICRQKDTTVIIIEHRLEDALYKDVDRIIVFGEGRIIADDTPDNILASKHLIEQGIREPLYISAIRHAGCEIDPATKPQHIETMNLEPYKQHVSNWFQSVHRAPRHTSTENALEARYVSFSYTPGVEVLSNISFRIKKGEMASIVGKNGAGKTTLSSLICGFYKPTSGQLLLNDKDITPLSIKERGERIGLCMQNPNQMISKPMIYDEVALGLVVRGVPEQEIKERVHHVLKVCGLYQMRNWPISALSFGQKKRVTIASVLVMSPEILILDEPTAGQDYRHYTEFMEFLKELNEKQGITIIMITHDMHLMLEYTHRVLVIADGKLLADDTPARILTNKEVAMKAYLKETSLYELSLKCGIAPPEEFVENFISYERSLRNRQ